MGVHDAPQWLLSAFVRSVQAVGGTAEADEIRRTGETLLARWTAPERHFHNLRHLVDVIARVDELTEETYDPEVVRLAAWYHGAIFDSAERAAYANRGGEDEVASARLAYDELTALGVSAEKAQRVHDLVVRLARHNPDPADPDSAVLCDADLAMLATEPQKYRAYLEDLRAEYAHVPVDKFLAAREHILRKLLGRPRLFVSPLSERWEEPARQNLTAELARVEKELAKLAAGSAGTASGATAAGNGAGTSASGSPAPSTTSTPA